VLGAAFGFDAGGGVWVNESAAGKRWYRRAGQAWWEPAAFAALHVHPLIVEAATGRRSWLRALAGWTIPVAGSAMVARLPEERRRPTAIAIAAGGGIVAAALAPRGWRWLALLLAWKLIVGHSTRGGALARWTATLPSVTSDERLAEAARRDGFTVLAPGATD
jgi:hypothetical protein